MTRDEAIAFFMNMSAYNDEKAQSYEPDFMAEKMKKAHDASVMAIAALQPWVRTAERPPTAEDAKKESMVMEYVFAYDEFHGLVEAFAWDAVAEDPVGFPYWMPIPPLPEVEEQ